MTEEMVLFAIDQLYCKLTLEKPVIFLESAEE
jgi:hypothetical protein